MDRLPTSGGEGGAGERRKGKVRKCVVNSTEIGSAMTPQRSTIEITCNQVNFLSNHYGTKSQNQHIVDAFLGCKCW